MASCPLALTHNPSFMCPPTLLRGGPGVSAQAIECAALPLLKWAGGRRRKLAKKAGAGPFAVSNKGEARGEHGDEPLAEGPRPPSVGPRPGPERRAAAAPLP